MNDRVFTGRALLLLRSRWHAGGKVVLRMVPVLLMTVLSACSTTMSSKQVLDEGLAGVQQQLGASAYPDGGQSVQTVRLPATIEQAMLLPMDVALSVPGERQAEHRFDLNAHEVPLKVFLMGLVKDTPYNMVVDPELTGSISLRLSRVTIDEVLDTVRDLYGMEYEKQSWGYRVTRAGLQTRIFNINYLNVRREGVSQIKISSGQISENRNAGQDDRPGGQSQQDRRSVNASVSGSKVDTFSHSDFWLEISDSVKAIVGEDDGGKVIVNPQSGIVIVRAQPRQLREVERYLVAAQNIIHRQVVLEAKILEVELSDAYQTGVNWSAVFRPDSDDAAKQILIGQTGGGTYFSGNKLSQLEGTQGLFGVNNLSQAIATTTAGFGGTFAAALELKDFSAFIEALESQGDVHVLSSPRVATVNNQKAVIKVGVDEFFITDINTETVNSSTVASDQRVSVDVELTPFFSGVALDVIPQIGEQGNVTLYIHPSVSQVNEKVKEIKTSNDDEDSVRLPLALSSVRESDSIVRARSGQVVVIGGLMQNVTRDERGGVPLLQRIPLLGSLFRHERQSVRKSELVILLRPLVVADNVAGDYLEETTMRLSELVKAYGFRR